MINWIRSLVFNILFYAWTAFSSTLLLPSVLINWQSVIWSQKVWSQGVMVLLRLIVGIKYEVRGLENIPDGPIIVACKHQSAWETMSLILLFSRPAYVLKNELKYIPVFGWYGKPGGHIHVDRKAGASAMRTMLLKADKAKETGRQILIFPEGNRRDVGAAPDYKPGVLGLYRHLKVPVVPAGLNAGLFWGRKSFLKQSGTIVVEFLPAIPAGLEKREFMRRMEDAIETSSNALIAEARGL